MLAFTGQKLLGAYPQDKRAAEGMQEQTQSRGWQLSPSCWRFGHGQGCVALSRWASWRSPAASLMLPETGHLFLEHVPARLTQGLAFVVQQ